MSIQGQAQAAASGDDTPEVGRVARDRRSRLGLVLEIDMVEGRVRMQDLTTGMVSWEPIADVRRVSAREELSLRLAISRARELARREAAMNGTTP